jgi:proteasome lid subunit RPN8/RPN11
LFLGVVPIILFGGPLSASSPGGNLVGGSDGGHADFSGDVKYIDEEDASFMSRIFDERNNEIAYCGRLTEGENGPILTVWLADTVRSSTTSVHFSTANCPPEMDDVLLHTHPSGNLALSQTDRDTIERRQERVTCVQGGRLLVNSGETIDNLACYRQTNAEGEDLELERVAVVLIDSKGNEVSPSAPGY